jgi:hypothetical protein
MTRIEKFSITPLDRCDWRLADSLPIELGSGLSIQNYEGRLPSVGHWDEYLSKDDIRQVSQWSACLEHRYTDVPHMAGAGYQASQRLLASAVACLRQLIPCKANGHHCLQLEHTNRGLEAFNYLRPVTPLMLEDCEILAPELTVPACNRFRKWIDWIVDFATDGQKYLPLWISLSLSEQARAQSDIRLHHLLQVMSIEAVLSDAKVYAVKAFKSRLLPLVTGLDLYGFDNSEVQALPPLIADERLLTDIVVLRNDIAHGRHVRPEWLTHNRRHGTNGQLSYAHQLTEAATALQRFLWIHILDNGMQAAFSDKKQMATYCETFSARAPGS